jgi:RNA polymerase sigma factor (sigma-70 family)
MVLGLCRSILHNGHDAEDIFQAAFLVLARKAASLRKSESVGSFLYAVAYRLARKARIRDGKRRQRERQAAPREATPMDDVTWGELRGVLHEEVSRLPEKCRAAIVLCYWEGRTHEQAAQQLGCARDTVKDRLERARELLRTRLARRGLALPAAWFAVSLAGGTSSSAVPTELLQATVRGAMVFAMGGLPLEIVSGDAIVCARRFLQTIFLGKLKYAVALMLMLGVLGGGAGWVILQKPFTEAPGAKPKTSEKLDEQPLAAKQRPKRDEGANDPLPPGAVARLGTLRFRHGDPIQDISLGADGKSIVSAAGKFVHIWELATGKERGRLAFEVPVPCVACSSDGKLLAAGCEDGTIRLCDAATQREVRRCDAHKGRDRDWRGPSGVARLQFTPDGRQLVSTGSDLAIRLWSTATGEQVHEIGRFRSVGGLDLSPDGKILAGVVKEGETWTIRLWEIATGKERDRLPRLGAHPVAVAFSPDGKTLAATVGEDDWNKPSVIKLWDMAEMKEIRTLRGIKGWVGRLTFSPDGKTLASIGSSGGALLWDVKTGERMRSLEVGFCVLMFKNLFLPDGKTLVSYGQEHTLRFWDAATGKEVRTSDGPQWWIGAVSFSPDGRLLASASADGLIQLWDASTRKEMRRFTHGSRLAGLPFSPDGRFLASASMFVPEVRIWETASGKEVRQFRTLTYNTCLAWSGDGKTLATWSREDRLVHLWDAATGKEVHRLGPIAEWVNAVEFAPDSRTLAVGVAEHPALAGNSGRGKENLLLWATDTGKLLRRLKEPAGIRCLAFAPDGRTIAAGGMDRAIHLWETAFGEKRLSLKNGEEITSLAYSSDGKLLAAVNNLTSTRLSSDGTTGVAHVGKPDRPRVRLWDVAAREELPSLQGHQGAITSLAFSPDGKLLATASNDTTVLLWDATRLKARGPASETLRPDRIESLWEDLAGADADKAYRAIHSLASDPKGSVDFLNRRMKPVPAADPKRVARLVADLDSAEFAVRQQAMRELEKLGDSAATELHKALVNKPSLEVKRRIESVLEKANGPEPLRTTRALEALEMMNTVEARELCAVLAGGVSEAQRTREAKATLQRMKRR